MLYGFGQIDAAGRVADRAVISALGWRCGDRLTLSAEAGVVTARRDPQARPDPGSPEAAAQAPPESRAPSGTRSPVLAGQRGGIRIAPSRRIVSPLT
jgi:hypothetical protein